MTTQDVQQIELALIELSSGTQSRAGYDETTLAEYTEAWERGVQFPPIEVYFDGEKYHLADGFHRVASRKRANVPGSTIAAIVHQGTRRDAVLHSVGANATHGLKRTNADKRRAVMTLLRDSEWCKWTNRAIADACGVDETLIRTIKSELSAVKPQMNDESLAKKCGVDVGVVSEARNQVESLSSERIARRKGKTYTVNTDKIGSKTSEKPDTTLAPMTDKPKTGWDISPQTLTTTVEGHKIAVHFERRDNEYFFGFRGLEQTISASGFHHEQWNNPKILKGYLNPGTYADFRAEELNAAYQKSLAEDTNTQANTDPGEHIPLAADADDDVAMEKPSQPGTPTKDLQWSHHRPLAFPSVDTNPTTVEQELEQKAEELGLPTNGNQVLPDVERNHISPLDVDDRPFAAISQLPPTVAVPKPTQATTQMLPAAVSACLGEFWIPENLSQPLQGKVYVSPDKAIGQWSGKLLKAYKDGEVTEAIALLPLDHQAFVKFADYALCPLPDGQVAVYLGKRVNKFVLCFEDLGTVWHRYGWRL